MATYEIRENTQYNSNEIYFDSKPAAEVLTALRGLKMRWNPKKGCWYGFAAQNDILAAIGEYDSAVSGRTEINHYRIDDNKIYTEAFRVKLHKINAVLDTYHYDDSNSMVDYFDTNFYRNITVVAA